MPRRTAATLPRRAATRPRAAIPLPTVLRRRTPIAAAVPVARTAAAAPMVVVAPMAAVAARTAVTDKIHQTAIQKARSFRSGLFFARLTCLFGTRSYRPATLCFPSCLTLETREVQVPGSDKFPAPDFSGELTKGSDPSWIVAAGGQTRPGKTRRERRAL